MNAFVAFALMLGADAAVGTSQAGTNSAPDQRTCLARHYNLTPAFAHGTWVVAFRPALPR